MAPVIPFTVQLYIKLIAAYKFISLLSESIIKIMLYCAVLENFRTSPTVGFLFCTPVLPRNSSLVLYFASKILTSKNPLPLGIFDDLPCGGYGFFGTAHCSVEVMILLHTCIIIKE